MRLKLRDAPYYYPSRADRLKPLGKQSLGWKYFEYNPSMSPRAIHRYIQRHKLAFEYFDSLILTKDKRTLYTELACGYWPYQPLGRFRGNKFAYYFSVYMCDKYRSLLENGENQGEDCDNQGCGGH